MVNRTKVWFPALFWTKTTLHFGQTVESDDLIFSSPITNVAKQSLAYPRGKSEADLDLFPVAYVAKSQLSLL